MLQARAFAEENRWPDGGHVEGHLMDFDFPTDDDPRRSELQRLAEHPSPTSAELHEAGLLVPIGLDLGSQAADPIHQLIIDEELKAAGGEKPPYQQPIGVGWAAPTILLVELTGKRTLSTSGEEHGANLQRTRLKQTLHRWQPGRFEMATSTSSTVQKSGRAAAHHSGIRNTHRANRP